MKVVEVRIAVVVNEDGEWAAWGRHGGSALGGDHKSAALMLSKHRPPTDGYHWVTAKVPLPERIEIDGEVSDAPALPREATPLEKKDDATGVLLDLLKGNPVTLNKERLIDLLERSVARLRVEKTD